MRISDWSSDVCSSDLSDRVSGGEGEGERAPAGCRVRALAADAGGRGDLPRSRIQESTVGWVERSGPQQRSWSTHRSNACRWVSLRSTHPTLYPSYASGVLAPACSTRSEEHTSELQSLMRISYAVFCLKKKK